MKLLLINVSVIMILLFIGCQEKNLSAQTSEKMNAQTKLIDVINRPEFAPFGHLLISQGVKTLSADDRICDLQKFYIWHSHISDATTLDALNEMSARIKHGEKIFYEIYDDERKSSTGLFFFRGRPHALYLSRCGYNAFALQYRTGSADHIVSWQTMQQRVDNLSRLDISTEFHKYSNLGHGFGLGLGTSADGWIDDAINFWDRVR